MVIAFERFGSRRTSADNNETHVEQLWRVEGTDDEQEVRAFVGATAPPIYVDSLTFRLLYRHDHTCEQIGPAQWDVVVNYQIADQKNQHEPSFGFDTSGGTTHITQSFGTKKYGSNAPDFKGAIGVRDKEVEGVDIIMPSLKFTETWQIPFGGVTVAYIKTLAGITGRVNDSPWRTYDAGEVLFMGASGQSQTDGYVPVQFTFEASQNATLSIAGIDNIQKNGWEYLWTYYKDTGDTDAKLLLKKPNYVYVETVYQPADFGLIGI
jgi:hypothetical protein